MDDPGMSLLKENGLVLMENEEEAEDLEEQMKRREELQNLLINVLDDFKFEDSTINSSTNISIASEDHNNILEETYRNAETSYEQLKILYDIRTKEIKNMKEEFETYKIDSEKELDSLRRKLTLQEAETSQVEITLKNTKLLLVEKIDIIAELEKEIASKNEEVTQLRRTVEKLQFDIQAFDTTIRELQLQTAMNTGPFCATTRNSMSEELKNHHKEQIGKLETIIQEFQKKIESLEGERSQLKEDLSRNIENSNKNEVLYNSTINLLSANVESAQNQCKDLLNIVEMLSKENEHYRNRIQKFEGNEPILLSESFKRKSLDYDSLLVCNERLKKMLLDKDVEVSTLKSKTKFYENDVKELIDYRNMKNESLIKNECNHPEHSMKITMIQSEIKNLRRELVEKKHEIIDLTSAKKELEDKIENMIIQTRNDIENLSNKYKLPELETMNDELKNAQEKISNLQEELTQSQKKIDDLNNKEKMYENMVNKELITKKKLEEENEQIKRELEQVKISNENRNRGDFQDDYVRLKKEFDQLVENLKKLDKIEDFKLNNLEFEDLKRDFIDGNNLSLNEKIESWINYFNLNCKIIRKLKESESFLCNEVEFLKKQLSEVKEKNEKLTKVIEELNDNRINLENQKETLEERFDALENDLKIKTEEVFALKNQEESNKVQEKKLKETIKKLEKEKIKNVDKASERAKEENKQDDLFKTKILEVEVSIRDKLNQEYEKKIKKIEETYKNIFEMNQRKLKDYKEQENGYRHQLADILNKYAQLILPIEKENNELKEHVRKIEKNYNDLKKTIEINNKEYLLIIEKTQKEAQMSVDAWKIWAKKFVQGCLNIEKLNSQTRNSVLNSMKNYDSQINSLNEYFDKNIKQYRHKKK